MFVTKRKKDWHMLVWGKKHEFKLTGKKWMFIMLLKAGVCLVLVIIVGTDPRLNCYERGIRKDRGRCYEMSIL